MKKTKKTYENYLNNLYDFHECRDKTVHCWAGSDKSESQRRNVTKLGLQNKYGTIIRKYDPIAFEVGFNDYKR